MCCKGFTKRVLPFFLTFAVGLLIASFFVSIAVPSFQFPNRSSRKRHLELDQQREIELQQLRDENFRLKNPQVLDSDIDYKNLRYVPAPPMPPVPPAPPTLKSIPRQGK